MSETRVLDTNEIRGRLMRLAQDERNGDTLSAQVMEVAEQDGPALCDALDAARVALREIAEYGGGDGGDWVDCCNIARAALGGDV